MFTYVCHNIIRTRIFIFPQAIIHYWFTFNFFRFSKSHFQNQYDYPLYSSSLILYTMLKYCQKSFNSRCFSILASAFNSIKNKAANAISLRIYNPWRVKWVIVLILKILYWKTKIIKGEPRVYYSLSRYKKKGSYDILTYISEHVTLVQLMDSLRILNHAINVVGYWELFRE